MHRRLLRSALALAVFSLPVVAGAQINPIPELRAGQRVRIELAAEPARVEGLLLQTSPQLLTVVSGRTRMQAIAMDRVTRLSVSDGRRISGRRTLLGLTLGPVVGAALGMGVGALTCSGIRCYGPEVGLVLGTGVGLVGGGVWGVWPWERWREVRVR